MTHFLGEKQAATHVSLDQEYDYESSQQWRELEEQVVALVNKGVIPSNFHPTQYCLNSYSDNSRIPLAVVEGDILEFLHMDFRLFIYHRFKIILCAQNHWELGCKNKLGIQSLVSCIYKTKQWGF